MTIIDRKIDNTLTDILLRKLDISMNEQLSINMSINLWRILGSKIYRMYMNNINRPIDR